MSGRIILYLFVLALRNVTTSMYFHELSPVLLKPPLNNTKSDFGFSMGFQDTIPPKLIVGAPRSDFIGKVHRCSIIDINEAASCEELDIDLPKLANYSLGISPDQNFYLGASIAATPNYFLTCAPLWISKQIMTMSGLLTPDVYGTCFVYNNTFYRYKGSFEKHVVGKLKHKQLIVGGTGWNTLLDDSNKLILVAKTSLIGDIVYVPSDNPLKVSTSLVDVLKTVDKTSSKEMLKFANIGSGLAAGNFFSSSTVYAFSMTSDVMAGQISFFKYTGQKKRPVEIVKEENKNVILAITNNDVGSMFGAVLCAADINGDGYSELIVGAPAHQDDDERFEQGAVYIYIGGDMKINQKTRMRTILATKDGGRFGSAMTTNDVDADEIPDIFISSPYEDAGIGAVYILSGREVKKSLLDQATIQQIVLSDLKFTQRLQAEEFRILGYSLQILSDLDDNGCNEIAVGSPGRDSVLLFRCIPSIYVTLSTQLFGAKIVSEKAENFNVIVCVNIEYPPGSSSAAGNLIVTMDIPEDDAVIPKPELIVTLAHNKSDNCNNVTVELKHKGPGVYNFNAGVELDLLKNNTILDTKVFNTTWVRLREDSETKKSIKIVRRCEAENCDPKLSVELHWSGSDTYTLGSSVTETVTVIVKNDGHDSYDSCLRVHVSGARVRRAPSCDLRKEGYKCSLSSPLERNINESRHITLDMSEPQSTDVKLFVKVDLYELCHQSEYTTKELIIPYKLTSQKIDIKGSTKDRNVTDVEILDNKIEIINDDHEYEIVNGGSVTWPNIYAEFTIEKRPFIRTYNVSSLTEAKCRDKDVGDKILFSCNFTLTANTTKKAIVAMGIEKDKIANNLIMGKLNTTSRMVLYLHIKLMPKYKGVTTIITYLKDRSILNNLTAIILGAILLAILVLSGFIFILYKANFFKRKQKKKLKEAQESVRRKSMKRNNPESDQQNKSNDDNVSIEVLDESPLRVSPASDDDIVLIQEEDIKSAREQCS